MTVTLEEAAAVPGYITLKGRTLKISPVLPIDLSEASAYLKNKTENPLDVLKRHLDGLPENVQEVLAKEAYAAYRQWGVLSGPEGRAWVNSIEGISFFLWLSARKNHPDLTLAETVDLLSHAALDELEKTTKKIDEVSGFDSGNSQRLRPSPASSTGRPKTSRATSHPRKRKRT